uniref:DNA polymerase n=1 Tax=Thelephora ganbajun TaxID=370292 RepID=A0A343B740_THEGA|nr:DNA polymerase [Thelephora ganbajun]
MIKTIKYNLNNLMVTNEVLNSYILRFWDDVFAPLIQDGSIKHLMVLCKVKYSESEAESGYKTLGPLRRVEFKDLELFKDYLIDRIGILIDSYSSNTISEIIFTFVIKDGEISKKDRLLLEDLSEKEVTFHEFNKTKLPVSMDPANYGIIRGQTQIDGTTRYFVKNNNSKRLYEIDVSQDQLKNKVSILGASDLKWTDTKLSENSFKREIGKATLYFLDGEIVLLKRVLPSPPFRGFRS